jgi:hypothetical protein
MGRIIAFLALLMAIPAFTQAQINYVPEPAAAYYSSDGTGNSGTWNPMTGSGGTAIGYVPRPAGIYYSTDGTGNAGTWAPCTASCFGGSTVTWPTSGDVVISNGTQSPAGIAPVNGECVVGSGGAWIAGSCAGSAATAFSAITGSTNTTAAMLVGTGASIGPTGTGTVNANEVNGATVPASVGFVATNSSNQVVAAAYTPANCTAGTTGSDCLQLSSGLVPVGNIPTAIPIANIGSGGLSASGGVAISSTGAISLSGIPLTALATQATNTIDANVTSGSAAPTAVAVSSCSATTDALIWTTNTGPGCNTSITAAAVPLSGITGLGTGVQTALGDAVSTGGGMVTVIAAGTVAMPTTAISSGACGSAGTNTVSTGSLSNVLTTDRPKVTYNSAPTAVTGYGVSAAGAVLSVYYWPTSGGLTIEACNSTASSITPGSITFNWDVER